MRGRARRFATQLLDLSEANLLVNHAFEYKVVFDHLLALFLLRISV